MAAPEPTTRQIPPYRFHAELRHKLNVIIFGTDTVAGRRFDLILIITILASVALVMLESITDVRWSYGSWLLVAEWCFTIAFTIEYLTRIYCTPDRRGYVFSFFGLVDLVSILPTYLALFLHGAQVIIIVRLLRVLRIFRVLKLIRYLNEANILVRALIQARRKTLVFLFSMLVLIAIFGAVMYVVEGPENGFTSIPASMYWAIVTITTVGYGDIAPHTSLGRAIAAMAMLTGYAIIAVPTGIITSELAMEMRRERAALLCASCKQAGHESDAAFCKFCGASLKPPRMT